MSRTLVLMIRCGSCASVPTRTRRGEEIRARACQERAPGDHCRTLWRWGAPGCVGLRDRESARSGRTYGTDSLWAGRGVACEAVGTAGRYLVLHSAWDAPFSTS